MARERIITAKYAGTCTACGELFARGERIRWTRGDSRHETCGYDAEAAAEARHFESYYAWQDYLAE